MKKKPSMLDKWAAHIDERRIIEAFTDWLVSRKSDDLQQGEWQFSRWLDEYHGIDQRQLENERRALLESIQ